MTRNIFKYLYQLLLPILFLTLFFTYNCEAKENIILANTDANDDANDDNFEKEFAEFESAVNKGAIDDPFENFNRKVYKFNDTIDKYFIEYIARSYREAIPKPARNCIRNFIDNLTLPISALNSFAQGKVDNGLATISNFLINSTLGVGGLFQIARNKGIDFEREDFGQTLGYYGVGSNKFLMLPFFGPSNPRDLGGFLFDRSVDPLGFNLAKIGGTTDFIDNDLRLTSAGVKIVDNREELLDIIDDVRKDSFDPYSTIRSAYLQRRLAQIEN